MTGGINVGNAVAVDVCEGVAVGVALGVRVAVTVGVALGVRVALGASVFDAVGVIGVDVIVGGCVGTSVEVETGSFAALVALA